MKKQSLILLHGWSFSPNYFTIIKTLLRKRYKLFTPIMPGFGLIPISSPYNLDKYSDWLGNYIKTNKIINPILLGHSFGGSVCLNYLSKYPNNKIKLVLVSAAIIRSKYSYKRKLYYSFIGLLKPIIGFLNIKYYLLKAIKLEDSDYQKISSPLMKLTFNQIIFSDLSNIAKKIDNNTLIIWGENDSTTPLTQGKTINHLIKNSTLKIIPDSGHFPFTDDPIEFVTHLNNFVKKN